MRKTPTSDSAHLGITGEANENDEEDEDYNDISSKTWVEVILLNWNFSASGE